jgi:Spy/CpxP family protein refolding chaperone
MKYLIFLITAGLLAAQPVFADSNGHPDRYIKRLEEKLNLSEDQAAKVADVMKAQHEKMRSVMEACHEQNKAKLEALQKDTDSQLSGILSAEQMQQFEAMKKDHMKRHAHRRGGPDDGQDTPDESAN